MNGAELSDLIAERHQILSRLLALGNQQVEAIAGGRMSELMRLLSEKQSPLQRLAEISKKLRATSEDDPAERLWPSPEARQQCRANQEACEQMHVELLAIEAHCETALNQCRDRVQDQLNQLDASRQAAIQYAHSQTTPSRGGRLDLSE